LAEEGFVTQSPEKETIPSESVFKPTLVLMCGRTLAFGSAFLIPIVLARIFTPEQFGTYKQVFLIYATFYGVVQLGMAESLYYFMPHDRSNAGRYVMNALLILMLAGLLCLALLMSEREKIAGWLNNADLASYIPLLGANLVFMVASAPLEIALVSNKRYRWAACAYASDLFRVIAFLVPIVIWRDLHALLVGGLAYSVIRFSACLFYFHKEFGSAFRFSGMLLWQQFAYALPFELAVLVETAQSNLHQYAVSHYFSAAAFAVYSVGCLQVPLIEFFASPAGNVMMVLMSERRRTEDSAGVVALWHDTTRKLCLVFLPLTALLMVVARVLIPFLFTQQYRASVPIFIVWVCTVAFAAFQTDAVLRVFAETRFLFVLNVIRLVLVLGLIVVLMTRMGAFGAVLATVLATATAKILALWRIKRVLAVSNKGLLPWGPCASIAGISLVACAGPLTVQALLQAPMFMVLAISGIAYATVCAVLLLGCGVLHETERTALFGWGQGIVSHLGAARVPRTVSEG
jgi:O-antigen/teichoic acid export membrane protein